jgi:membrane-bound lytic murein transglycosylase F
MRKNTALLSLAGFLAVAPVSADLAEVKKTGVLRVLVVDGAPYFLSLRGGDSPGLEREILDGFARLEGIKVQLVEVPEWKDLVPALVQGKGDLVAGGVTDTPARRGQIDFTAEVFPSRNVILSYKPSPVITTLEQLRLVRVGTIRGSNLAASLAYAKIPKANIDDAVPATGFLATLRSRRVVALVDAVEDALILQQEDPNVQIGMFVGAPESLAFGVRKEAPRLRDALSEYVSNVRRTPTWNRLVVKYFGASAAEVLKKTRAAQ